MEMVRNSPSPNVVPVVRRRKKRSTSNGIPGSSLGGLNRNNIHLVELSRSSVGYGFTISGQKPCLLRCIVEGSPADRANLKPGNCLVGVNGKDVSHLAHDDVVALIGECTGLLRLHVAESYFSESSDEESLQVVHSRPKYHHRVRASAKSANTSGGKKYTVDSCHDSEYVDSQCVDKAFLAPDNSNDNRKAVEFPETCSHPLRRLSREILSPGPRRVPYHPIELGEESPIPALPARNRKVSNPNVESVRVFSGFGDPSKRVGKVELCSRKPAVDSRRYKQVLGADSQLPVKTISTGNPSPSSNSGSSVKTECSGTGSSIYQAVVGYIGSIELPAIEEKQRLQVLTACVKRLRVERKMRSIVLLRIHSNGISLFTSNQNAETGPPLAFYSSSIISFCGAYSDDRRFFGLVTCTGVNKNCSCHVFMVEPKLLSHLDHSRRARAFGIQCTAIPLPKNGQVLGLQECTEFPATADPILSSIVRFHCPVEETTSSHRSPSEASTRLESTNSSNSDSGIGFRDESDRHSARIYDIVETELLFDVKNIRRSPEPRRRYPHLHHKHVANNFGNLESPAFIDELDLVGSFSDKSLPLSLNSQHSRDGRSAKLDQSFGKDLRFEVKKCRSNSVDLDSVCSTSQPQPIEVSAVVVSPSRSTNSGGYRRPFNQKASILEPKTPLSRKGTRSLENLCSEDNAKPMAQDSIDAKGKKGSTPAINQESMDSKNSEFWEFKVPKPPKPKVDVSQVESWSENIEKLLHDTCGRHVFTEFLQQEFAAENIHFYNACVRFKDCFNNLTQSQRISMASTIFQRFLQNGATDPVNVDFQAKSQVEKALSSPTSDVFDLPQAQVFNLLKFDCYPRFLRSEMYRGYLNGSNQLPQFIDDTDSDQDSVKSHKLDGDSRRRSLLPWHIKNRSKKSAKHKNDDRLNSDISFIQRTAMQSESSDTEDGRRVSYKLCRITLPDNSTTVFPCVPGETLSTVVQRLLEKRDFHYSAFEVISTANGKALDLTQDVSEMSAREIKVEPRAFVGIELPKGWRVGVRANPTRKIAEVLKPILSQHSLKLDSVAVYDIDLEEPVDVKWQMGRVDGHNILVKCKDSKLGEITNHVPDSSGFDNGMGIEDDVISNKTSSSQASSVFRDFLRRSSKKYKRKAAPKTVEHPQNSGTGNTNNGLDSNGNKQDSAITKTKGNHLTSLSSMDVSPDENSLPTIRKSSGPAKKNEIIASPLTLVSSEFKLGENSRNRKPIYISHLKDKE